MVTKRVAVTVVVMTEVVVVRMTFVEVVVVLMLMTAGVVVDTNVVARLSTAAVVVKKSLVVEVEVVVRNAFRVCVAIEVMMMMMISVQPKFAEQSPRPAGFARIALMHGSMGSHVVTADVEDEDLLETEVEEDIVELNWSSD